MCWMKYSLETPGGASPSCAGFPKGRKLAHSRPTTPGFPSMFASGRLKASVVDVAANGESALSTCRVTAARDQSVCGKQQHERELGWVGCGSQS